MRFYVKNKEIELSSLDKTWIFDIDGTIVKHNGYKIDGYDTLIPGVKDFFDANVRENDYVLLATSREEKYKDITERFLKDNSIRFDKIIYNLPYGERIIINDDKPSGLKMAYAISIDRDSSIDVDIKINNQK